jgi:hypothetical protein
MPCAAPRCVRQHRAQERIEPDDVGHAEHHGDVHDVDVGRRVPEATVETMTFGKP